MSAEDQGSPETIDAGPVIITVPGQDGHVDTSTPPETAVPAAKEEPTNVENAEKKEATGSEEQVEDDQRDEKGRFKPGVQARIDELTRKRHEAEREAQYWKGKAEGAAPPEPKPAAPEPKQVPTRDAFDTEDAYIDALTDHKLEVKLAARDQQSQQTKAREAAAGDWQSKLTAARADIPDFDAVMDKAEIPVAPHVAELITKHPQGAKVIHHFATHPSEMDALNGMAPADVAFAIAEIGMKFKSASSSEPVAAAKPVKVSEAPPPAARNVGAGRSTTVPLGEQSMEDYIATRKSQGASWAR